MTMIIIGLLIVFPFLLAYAASSDLLTMLIPNWISLALVSAFAVLAIGSGMAAADLGWHLAAAMLTLSATFTLFALGLIGGGDAKLAPATALWLGLDGTLDYLLAASIVGGALTLALLYVRTHPLPGCLTRLPFAANLHDRRTGVPYGIALAAAGLVVMPQTDLWVSAFGA